MLEIPKRLKRRHEMGAFERLLEDERNGRFTGKPKPKKKPGKNAKRKQAARERVASTKKQTRQKGYQWYINSAKWRHRRERFLNRKGRVCEVCGSTENITVHHKTYARIGNERDRDLQVLCCGCHNNLHEGKGGDILDPMTREFLQMMR